eukprot:CAMPEP_0194396054 /NCGR_PEP_ID=MMETSP0174-20130528/124772_1 /TAXON_ID=216777 /ORGANISM="Proboscia alata, Strain PI-D3" /LENGTH=152 /DNA_ID=CAMNT_0039192071 /DNA_START=627 /DNA_END=1085 /DNA_ORIENTATION=+
MQVYDFTGIVGSWEQRNEIQISENDADRASSFVFGDNDGTTFVASNSNIHNGIWYGGENYFYTIHDSASSVASSKTLPTMSPSSSLRLKLGFKASFETTSQEKARFAIESISIVAVASLFGVVLIASGYFALLPSRTIRLESYLGRKSNNLT